MNLEFTELRNEIDTEFGRYGLEWSRSLMDGASGNGGSTPITLQVVGRPNQTMVVIRLRIWSVDYDTTCNNLRSLWRHYALRINTIAVVRANEVQRDCLR